jgi:RNA polymerase sigma-70 factor, ECF subfamily
MREVFRMEISEGNVLRELGRRNQQAIEFVIDNYSRSVYSLVHNILRESGSREDMDECVSEVFSEVWNKFDSYDEDRGSLKTWVLIISKYKALDYRRKLSKDIISVCCDDVEIASPRFVEDEIISQYTKMEVIRAINSLGDIDKKIFMKKYFYYETSDTIAKSFNITREAVDNRLSRGRKKIKQILIKNEEEVI